MVTVAQFSDRIARVRQIAADRAIDALLITPGPDLRYLTGYDAVPLERLTCLIIPVDGEPGIVVPALEQLAATASPIGRLGMALHPWTETQDPFALVAQLVPSAQRVGLDDHMWASKVLGLRTAMPHTEQVAAGSVIEELRMRKDAAELDALREAGAAIDRVHARIPALIMAGRSECEIGKDIAELILEEGHISVDFVIVASGPNGASPHHEVSDRRLEVGDPIVIDIGGTMPSGYRSDCTRMYALGLPPAEYLEHYAALKAAQEAACAAVRPGLTCAELDEVARDVLASAGLGEVFIHRTGHGIGMETHEAPYIVAGNDLALAPGMTFSIEPGFYLQGRFGARIEDIVCCGDTGAERLNHGTRDLVVVEP